MLWGINICRYQAGLQPKQKQLSTLMGKEFKYTVSETSYNVFFCVVGCECPSPVGRHIPMWHFEAGDKVFSVNVSQKEWAMPWPCLPQKWLWMQMAPKYKTLGSLIVRLGPSAVVEQAILNPHHGLQVPQQFLCHARAG